MCTDGLTGMVGEDRIAEILGEREDPQAAADALVEAANEAGGQDNITVVILDISGDGELPATGEGASDGETAGGRRPPRPRRP